MNVNHKLELLDQLDDAAFALMMDEYAEAEGERLRAEFEAATRAGLTPPKPEGLDEKCRKMIKAEYGKARWAEYGARARKMAVKAAAMVLIGIGIAAAMVMSVEAIRVPFWKYVIDHFEGHSKIDLDQSNPSSSTPAEATPSDPLFLYQPTGYQNTYLEEVQGRVRIKYENESGNYLNVSMNYQDFEPDLTDSDRSYSCISLNGLNAYYSTENERRMEWWDQNIQTEFIIRADALPENAFLSYCEYVAMHYSNATLENPSKALNPLPSVLPDHYEEYYLDTSAGFLYCLYRNGEDTVFSFKMQENSGKYLYNTEGATTTQTTVLDYEAIYVKASEYLTLIWFDETRELLFACNTYGNTPMAEEEFISLCEYLAEYYKDMTLPAVSTVILP